MLVCYIFLSTMYVLRAGARAVDLGEPSVYQGRPNFEIRHKSRCLQKSNLPLAPALDMLSAPHLPTFIGAIKSVKILRMFNKRWPNGRKQSFSKN